MEFEVPARIADAEPDSARLAQIRERFAKSAGVVRPLPSNTMLMLITVAAFIVFALILTVPVSFKGFVKMSAADAAIAYSAVLLPAFVMAGIVVEQMIPGSRRVMSPLAGVLLAALLLSVTALMLFPDFNTRNFMQKGFPCLELGLICAVPGAGATWLLMRRGFVVEPVSGAIAGGAMSGLLGIAVLALHCPIFNAAHIIGWHLAVIAVTSVAGALLGWIFSRAD